MTCIYFSSFALDLSPNIRRKRRHDVTGVELLLNTRLRWIALHKPTNASSLAITPKHREIVKWRVLKSVIHCPKTLCMKTFFSVTLTPSLHIYCWPSSLGPNRGFCTLSQFDPFLKLLITFIHSTQ
jgi:hypothetical protein